VSEFNVRGEVVTDHESAFGVEMVSRRCQRRPSRLKELTSKPGSKGTRGQGNTNTGGQEGQVGRKVDMDGRVGLVGARIESTRLTRR
jgi:hypothetical protein